MQNPHCTAPTSPKAHAYTSRSRGERPSMVVTALPSSLAVVSLHARHAFPSTRTEQEPQTPSAQPSFTEVKRASSRRYSSRFLSAATVTTLWFSVNWNIRVPPWKSIRHDQVNLPRRADLLVVVAYLRILGIPEALTAHRVEKLPGVPELYPVTLFLLEELFLHGGPAEVKNVVVRGIEENVARPAFQDRWRQVKVAAVHLLQDRVVAVEAVSRDGHDVVSRPQAEVLCQLDGTKDIGDAGWADRVRQAPRRIPIPAQPRGRISAIVKYLDALYRLF